MNTIRLIRITPAGAGKTSVLDLLALSIWDHPRRCGENIPSIICGSASTRITPAGAGKTFWIGRTRTCGRDHPRRCGENSLLQDAMTKCQGSPPQVRGKRDIKRAAHINCGITPAGAGKTRPPTVARDSLRDHPRRCGENVADRTAFCLVSGSPPQVRGKLVFKHSLLQQHRITPAGAGKTFCHHKCEDCGWDHPRRCGENLLFAHKSTILTGSPPQVRGKRTKPHA